MTEVDLKAFQCSSVHCLQWHSSILLQASHMLTKLMRATQWDAKTQSTCKHRPQPSLRHRRGAHGFADDEFLTQVCMLPADLQAAAPAQAAQPQAQAQASAAPVGAGRPPTPGTQPGMWPGAQPAAVAGFPGTAAHQLSSQSMTAHQPSSPAHLRMPQGMPVQQSSSQAQQTAYMQQPIGHLHQPQMRQQQAQGGGHQGPMQGLLYEGMLLPGHQEVGHSLNEGGNSQRCMGCLLYSVFVVFLQGHCCSSRAGLTGLPVCEHLSHPSDGMMTAGLHSTCLLCFSNVVSSMPHQTATQAAGIHKGLTTAVSSLAVRQSCLG